MAVVPGELRHEFGVLPPGDVRNCLAALLEAGSPVKQLLEHRMGDASHPVGNLLLTALTQITGSFPEAVSQLGRDDWTAWPGAPNHW